MIIVILNGHPQEFPTKEELREFVHTTVDQIFDDNPDVGAVHVERVDK
jgi:hypothetical protein